MEGGLDLLLILYITCLGFNLGAFDQVQNSGFSARNVAT
jgi:hypothetical protein